MNESENYLDQLLNAVDGRSDLNDSDPVNPEEIESKEQMPQKSTRETIDIPDSNDLFMDQFEQELRKDNDPDEFLKQFEQELDRDESSQGVTKATQPMLDDIDQIMESVNQEAANDTAEMAASAVEKTAEQKEDTAEVKNDEDASEDGIDDLAIDDIGIDDFGLDDPETENEKAVSDEDDELMRILSGTGEDSEIPEADNAKAEVQPDDEVKEEKKPKKQKSIPVEESTPVPVTNNVPNSEPEFAAGYAPAERPLETDWTTEESSHSGWWDDSESKIPGSSGFDSTEQPLETDWTTEEPAPQPEENESYTARFKKVVVQESTYTEPEQPKKPRKPKKEKTPRVKVQKPVPPEPKSIPNQEAEIRVNINLLRNAVFFRTVSLAVLTVIGAFLAIGESSYTLLYPALSQLMTVRGYCFLHLILGLLILFITFPTVINGMRKLFHREADSDTIAAMPLIPCLLTVLATIFVPEPMQHNLVHIFLPVSSFILLMNSIGKLFIIRRATRNFALLTKNFEKYIVTCVQSETAAEELTRGVVQDYPILATIRKTKQMSDFLRHTYASDLADRFSKKLAPIVAGISLLLAAAITGIRIGVLETPAENIPFFCSVLTMLLTAGCSAGIPLTVNLPLDRASKRLCPHGCTLLGYQSVDDFYDVNSILVPAATLFPKQSITISGIKNFSGFQVEEALLDAASMVYAADSILQNAFAALVEEKDGGMLYQVEDCSYEDNLGICGWIRHRRVLLGNREMMMAHHVEGMPTKVRELEMTSGSQDVLYLSVSGVVAGMFVIDITADPMVKRQMQRLKEEQISVIVKSVDSCITLQRLTTLFGVPDSMLKILPSADNDLYEKETAPLQDVSASTIHDGSFFGTARLLLEARSIKRAATTGLLLQVIAVILGLSICIGYILVNGYDNITSQTLLFFQLVMTGLTLLTTRLK